MSIAWWHRFSAPTGASWPRARWGPGCVVVPQVSGHHLAQWCSLTISSRSKSSRRSVPMILSQIAFALGACGELARILMPSAVNTASKAPVNWPARSLIRNLTEVARWPRFIRMLRAAWVVHAPSGFAVMPARWTRRVPCSMTIRRCAAGAPYLRGRNRPRGYCGPARSGTASRSGPCGGVRDRSRHHAGSATPWRLRSGDRA